jgi:hypothetical protein
MSIWNWFFDDEALPVFCDTDATTVAPMADTNPATGLPMFDGIGGLDVAGNPFGMDWNNDTMETFSAIDVVGDWGDSGSL